MSAISLPIRARTNTEVPLASATGAPELASLLRPQLLLDHLSLLVGVVQLGPFASVWGATSRASERARVCTGSSGGVWALDGKGNGGVCVTDPTATTDPINGSHIAGQCCTAEGEFDDVVDWIWSMNETLPLEGQRHHAL